MAETFKDTMKNITETIFWAGIAVFLVLFMSALIGAFIWGLIV